MPIFTVSRLEVEIEKKRCRVNKATTGDTKKGAWIQLPIDESQLSLSNRPATDIAISVAAYEMEGGGSGLRNLLIRNRE
ncbi:MAG TPA: hypothetical protein VNH83_05790 [Bryobacteraceae bacterium]|nr:hypothetical protein [Bryobacteraceae bacterium]